MTYRKRYTIGSTQAMRLEPSDITPANWHDWPEQPEDDADELRDAETGDDERPPHTGRSLSS